MFFDDLRKEFREKDLADAEKAKQAEIEKKFRVENKMCYCDLQVYLEDYARLCEFCFEKSRQELDQDQLSDWADAQNKHWKELCIEKEDNLFIPLRSKE